MLKKLLLGLAPMLLLQCGQDRTLNTGVSETQAFPPTFTEIRKRIIEPKCASCHESFVSHSILTQGFVVAGSASRSEFFEEIEEGAMPPYGGKLLDAEIEAIRVWIDNGAQND